MVREIKLEEAEALLKMQCQLDQETRNMMYEVGERPTDINQTREMLQQLKEQGSLMLIAEENGELVGFLSAERGCYQRIRHTAYIVIGILQEYRGKGLGTALFKALDRWSLENQIKRLELTVMCHNEAGLHLYQKNGFEVEGIKKKSMFVDGQYVDEYYMARIIE